MDGIFDYNRWPWGETSDKFPEYYKGNKSWPKLSVIIPSYNQGGYIEETILSVINQNYPNIEIIIIDGGSNDNTIEVIKKYEKHIHYWVSEKDNGQSHAINKGLEKSKGEWIAWLNSDDCYLKNALYYLFNLNDIEPYEFIYGNYFAGRSLADSREIKVMNSDKMNLNNVIRFFYGIDYIIPSQSVFIKREIIEKVGLINEELHYCMDVDWYARIMLLKPKVFKSEKTFCFFRHNEFTKTGSFNVDRREENKMGIEAENIALTYFPYLNFIERIQFKNLYSYYLWYSKAPWKHDNSSLSYLIKLVARHPFRSLSDRRILGLVKRKLLLRG